MSAVFKIFTFILVTIGLLWVSWPSLRDIRSHGFYRFFLWESLVVLILMNLDKWFSEPFSFRQIVSWLLFVISIFTLILGVITLHRAGKPDPGRQDAQLRGIEKTTRLVSEGIYHYIRHPIYSSVLSASWGIFLKRPSAASLCLVILSCLFMVITAKREEIENISYFGDAYRDYMKRTKMFIPYIF